MRQVYPSSSIGLNEPWTWIAVLDGTRKCAMVFCECRIPLCLEGYSIQANGLVTPALECHSCGLKEQVRLLHWAAAA